MDDARKIDFIRASIVDRQSFDRCARQRIPIASLLTFKRVFQVILQCLRLLLESIETGVKKAWIRSEFDMEIRIAPIRNGFHCITQRQVFDVRRSFGINSSQSSLSLLLTLPPRKIALVEGPRGPRERGDYLRTPPANTPVEEKSQLKRKHPEELSEKTEES